MTDLKAKTIADFGEQWTAFRDNPGYYGSTELLSDLLGPLYSPDSIKDARVADIGSGTGRIVNMLLDAGAALVIAVEPSDAMEVLKQNTASRADRITYLRGSGETLPANLNLDLVVSIGVLHHVPNPDPIVRAAYDALAPGGFLVIWLYGHEGNEAYLRFAEPMRHLTTRLPHRLLVALSVMLGWGLDLYILLCRFIPLPMRDYMRNVVGKFPRKIRQLTIYDQLNPAYAKYYRRAEALDLLSRNDFIDVTAHHRHGYSWTVIGRRQPSKHGIPAT